MSNPLGGASELVGSAWPFDSRGSDKVDLTGSFMYLPVYRVISHQERCIDKCATLMSAEHLTDLEISGNH